MDGYVANSGFQVGVCVVCKARFAPHVLGLLNTLIYCGAPACVTYTDSSQTFREDTPERREICSREWDGIQWAQEYMKTRFSPPPADTLPGAVRNPHQRALAARVRDCVMDHQFGRLVDQSGLMIARPAPAPTRARSPNSPEIISLPSVVTAPRLP